MAEQLQVTMLGRFSIRLGDGYVDENSNRMKKVWLLLAYLIYSRNTRTSQEQFLSVIQGADAGEIEDPAGRLKALFYRARAMLGQLYESAGHDLIVRKSGAYAWNTDVPLTLDVEEFEKLCSKAARTAEPQEKMALYRQALPMYQGDFLSKLSMEQWVMPISAYYHQMYMHAVGSALDILLERQQWQEAADICSQALKVEPYSEAVYQSLMRCRLAMDDKAGAMHAYEEMSALLFDAFGVMPSDESRQLYREASKQANHHSVPIGTVREQLKETEGANGAILCEYDFFRFLYNVQARSIIRSGEVIHIALFTVQGQHKEELSRRSLDRAVENLQNMLLGSLRRGDVVSQCSVSQLIVMLPQANYENSCAVCDRLTRAFYRQYPHTPADVTYSVQPLEPDMLKR